jgi:hypothetical protein
LPGIVGARMSTRIWLPLAVALNCSPPKFDDDWSGNWSRDEAELPVPGVAGGEHHVETGFGLNFTMNTVAGIGM